MAQNGTRGPNDFRGRDGRKRREPPIIDASATEVPVTSDPPAGSDPEPADAVPHPAEPIPAAASPEPDVPPIAEPAPVPTADAATVSPSPVEGGLSDARSEPVLFGSPKREAAAASEPAEAGPADGGDPRPTAPGEAEAERASPVLASAAPAADGPPASGGIGAMPPPSAPRSGNGAAPWLLTLSTLVLLGALAWVLYAGQGREGRDAAALNDLRGKVAALEARPDPAQAQAAVAALDKRVAAADTARTDAAKGLSDLSTRLDALTGQVRSAQAAADKAASAAGAAQAGADKPGPTGAAAAATVGALAALAVKVDALDGRVASASSDASRTAKAVADLPKPVPPDFGPTDARIATLDTRIGEAGTRADAVAQKVGALDARFTALEGKVNGSDARLNGFDAKVNAVDAKANAFDARVNGVDNRVNGLDAKLDDGAKTLARLRTTVADLPKVDLAPLQSATSALDGRVAKLDGQVSRIDGQLSASKDGARATEARAVGSADLARAAPIALVAQAVERAIAEGRPYAGDLGTLKALGADPAMLARLAPSAAGGAPTAASLRDRWAAVKGDVLAAVAPAGAGDSALDRFAAGARALVQVRSVDAAPGSDGSALVSQVSAALDGGDVGAALSAWTKLPQAGRDASKGWGAAAGAGLDAAAAARSLVDGAIATLGRG